MSEEIMQELREKIERTDREIVRLLNERAAVSVEIGKTKRAAGREIYDPARESMVYRHLEEFNDGILSEAALRGVFREILSASRFLQTPTTVAFLGPGGSPPYPRPRSRRSSTRLNGGKSNGGSFPSKTPPRVRSRPRWIA